MLADPNPSISPPIYMLFGVFSTIPFSESITAISRLARRIIRSATPINCDPSNELCIVNGFVIFYAFIC